MLGAPALLAAIGAVQKAGAIDFDDFVVPVSALHELLSYFTTMSNK
jgi:hypothetical protein